MSFGALPDHNNRCKWAFKNFSRLLQNHALANQDVLIKFCDVKKIFMKGHSIMIDNKNDKGATQFCNKEFTTLMAIDNTTYKIRKIHR